MHPVGEHAEEAAVRAFAAWLERGGIAAQVEQSPGGWVVLVEDRERAGEASLAFARFLQESDHPRWWGTGADAPVAPTTRALPWLTWALLAGATALTLATGFGADAALVARFAIDDGPRNGPLFAAVLRGEVWRLATPVLLHFSVLHLVGNALWLLQLGRVVEARHGVARTAALYAAMAVVPNVVQYLVGGPRFGGLSGVVYAVFGYVWIRGRVDPASGWRLRGDSVAMMLVWFGLCFTGLVGPIANAAHAAGLGLGAAFGVMAGLRAKRDRVSAP